MKPSVVFKYFYWQNFIVELFESKVRIGILNSLREGNKSLVEVREDTKSTSQAINKQVKTLINIGLVKRPKRGQYELTSLGEVLASKIASMSDFLAFVGKYHEFCSTHNIDELPEELLSRIGELKNSYIIKSDVSLDSVHRMITLLFENARGRVIGITPVITVDWAKAVIASAERGIKFSIVTTSNVVKLQGDRDYRDYPYMMHPNIEKRLYQDIHLALTSNGREAVLAFYEDNVLDLRNVIASNDEKAVQWVEDLFWWYWERGEPVE
jgi:predicted transcriptional regulator